MNVRLTFQLVKRISIIPAGISTVLCLFIFVTTIWIWSRKHARPTIDRISFRLFWWTMGFELFYDIAYIIGESFVRPLSLYENVLMADWVKCWWCSLCCGDIPSYSTNGRVSSLNFLLLRKLMRRVNYLCTCIAINLMLIICFGVNPNGKS